MKIGKKKYIALSVLVAVLVGVIGAKLYLHNMNKNTKCVMNASRMSYSLEEGTDIADAIVEVEIKNIVEEIDSEGLPQTIHRVQVVDVIKGELTEEILLLQDGTEKIPMEDNPIFQYGEKYILMIKKANSVGNYDNLYWILKEYFVSEEQAIETIPTGEQTAYDETLVLDNELVNDEIEEKKEDLAYETDILEKDKLIDQIEEELIK